MNHNWFNHSPMLGHLGSFQYSAKNTVILCIYILELLEAYLLLGVGLLGGMINACVVWLDFASCPHWDFNFAFPPACFPTASPTKCIVRFLDPPPLSIGKKWYLSVVLYLKFFFKFKEKWKWNSEYLYTLLLASYIGTFCSILLHTYMHTSLLNHLKVAYIKTFHT